MHMKKGGMLVLGGPEESTDYRRKVSHKNRSTKIKTRKLLRTDVDAIFIGVATRRVGVQNKKRHFLSLL